MKYLISLILVLLALECDAQISVYQCPIDPVVTQSEMDGTNHYIAPCILFKAGSTYFFDLNDNKTAEASKQIDVEPGFDSENFLPGKGLTLVLCDELRDIVCFSHTDLSNNRSFKKIRNWNWIAFGHRATHSRFYYFQ